MRRRVVEVATGSRLHFGLMSFGQAGVRQFGGAGAMIDRPSVRLRITAADQLTADGPASAKVLAHAEAVAGAGLIAGPPHCRIEVVEMPAPHVGLGSGTQLAMAVAAGLTAFFGVPVATPEAMARTVGRGRRSAVGLHGFHRGGLLAEAGKLTDDEISPLVSRVRLPDAWRFVVLYHRAQGLSGEAELGAFQGLPAVPADLTARMWNLAMTGLVPAAVEGRFDLFSESLYRFGVEAGQCFAPWQGGTYASDQVAALVNALRDRGVVGVGQSSWGPAVFAVLPNEQAARETLIGVLETDVAREAIGFIARPKNDGAHIRCLSGNEGVPLPKTSLRQREAAG